MLLAANANDSKSRLTTHLAKANVELAVEILGEVHAFGLNPIKMQWQVNYFQIPLMPFIKAFQHFSLLGCQTI